MKQFVTILCSITFVISGAMIIGLQPKSTSSIFPGNMTMYAQPKPFQPFTPDLLKAPLTPQPTLDERTLKTASPKIDTLYLRDTVFVDKLRFVTKRVEAPAPQVVEIHDTVCVPVFFLATPLEYEVESAEIVSLDDETQGVQEE